MLDYSIDGRVCIAGMTSKGRCNAIYLILLGYTSNARRIVQMFRFEYSFEQFDRYAL